MHSFHPYVQRRRKRRRIGGRVVERRNIFWGRNVLFTTQVRRGVLRLFGISSAVSPSPPGSSSPWGSAQHQPYPGIPGEEQCPRAALGLLSCQATPATRLLGNLLLAWRGAGTTSQAKAPLLARSGGVCFTWVRRGGWGPGKPHTAGRALWGSLKEDIFFLFVLFFFS